MMKFWNQSDSIQPPQLIELSQHKDEFNSVNVTEIKFIFLCGDRFHGATDMWIRIKIKSLSFFPTGPFFLIIYLTLITALRQSRKGVGFKTVKVCSCDRSVCQTVYNYKGPYCNYPPLNHTYTTVQFAVEQDGVQVGIIAAGAKQKAAQKHTRAFTHKWR